jgi:hypothetical protein
MKKPSLFFISFLQALGLTLYCFLVSLIFWNGATWFGAMNTFMGPFLLLSIFVVSAVICALMFGGYAFILFWEKKKTKEAMRLIFYTIGWLIFFVLTIIAFLKLY